MKLHHTTKPLLISVAVSILAQSALTQVSPPAGYGAASPPRKFEGSFDNTDRIAIGPVLGDLIPGAALLTNGQVRGLFEPAFHGTVFDVETQLTVTDMDLVMPAVVDGLAGIALAIGDEVWIYEVDTDPLGSAPFVKTKLHTFAADVDMLRAGDIDGDGDEDLMCVFGSQVKFLVDSGTGWSVSPNLDFTAGGTPRELVAMQWDTVSPSSNFVAVQLGQSVQIWKHVLSQPPGYALDETFLAAATGGYMTLMPATTVDPVERLAWTSPVPGQPANQVLMVLSKGGNRVLCGSPLAATPNTLVSGVLTVAGSSRVDLLTTTLLDKKVRVFPYITPDYYDPLTPWIMGSTGTTLPIGAGTPGFGDATGDGIPDALVENDDLYFFAGQEPRLADPESPNFVPGATAWSNPTLSENGGSQHSWFDITVDLPSFGNFTHAQVLLWESPDGLELVRQTKAHYLYDLATLVPVGGNYPLRLSLLNKPACFGSEAPYPPPYLDAFYISLRLIQLQGDTILSATEAIRGGFAVDTETAGTLSGGEPVEFTVLGCQGSTAQRPGFIPLASLPPIEDGFPPQILPPQTGTQP